MPRANQAISINKTVRNPPTVVRAFVANHDEAPTSEPCDGDPLRPLARGHDLADLDAARDHVADTQ